MMRQGDAAGAALAALFADALAAGFHPLGCGCGGGVAPMISAASLEADLLDYLLPRYEKSGAARLAEFVRARRRARAGGFTDWLRGLDAAPLDVADRARFDADLRGVLEPMVQAAAGGGRFFCV